MRLVSDRGLRLLSRLLVCVSVISSLVTMGCSRSHYRLQADNEAYCVIGERNGDPRWQTSDARIDIDPRSRYFDQFDPDCPPMPLDDPTSHQYMQCVDGKRGWKYWHDNGVRTALENPEWYQALAQYVPVNEEGAVKLNLDSAIRLAYVHSPLNQTQLETLYLSALDVTGERFRLDSQFFGGYNVVYNHDGSLVPASLNFDSTTGNYVVSPPSEGVDSNRLTVGRPTTGDPALQMQRRFATAGQLIAGFANSFVFEFSGGDVSLASSIANFTFLQPLLRGAGRDIALEQLTQVERTLLANLRAYSQFRQGFYTQVAIGEVGVLGPQRFARSTDIQVFSGQGFLGGYVGLLQQLQEIRNSENNLELQIRTLQQLEALQEFGLIELVQVDQFRQSVESERARLLQTRNNFERALDVYKTDTLGLPPDTPIDLDDDFISQFQLFPSDATELQTSIENLQDRVGIFPEDVSADQVQSAISAAYSLLDDVRIQLDGVETDMERMNDSVQIRSKSMSAEEQDIYGRDRDQLEKATTDLNYKFEEAKQELEKLEVQLATGTEKATARQLIIWIKNLLRYTKRSLLVRARTRLEAVTVQDIKLDSLDAFQIALRNRLDFMNGRAALVDSWRQIQVRADALQSVLNLTATGDLRTARNNALSFRAPTGSLSAGVEFDAPLTRLLERNDYREALITYQRSRRDYIQSRDSLHLGLRTLLRNVQQLRTNLEIQRRAVAIAIRRVDLTQEELFAPQPPPRPGQAAAQFGPTSAFNLLSSLSALRDTQNSFLRAWLEYYAARMRLARELGVMQLDPEGKWVEMPPPGDELDANGLNESVLDRFLDEAVEQFDGEQINADPADSNSPNLNGDLPPPVPTPIDGTTASARYDMTLLPLIPEDQSPPSLKQVERQPQPSEFGVPLQEDVNSPEFEISSLPHLGD